MRNKRKIIIGVANILACIILFICLGLVVTSNLSSDSFSDKINVLDFWSRYGISVAFFLTVLALIFLYINQKILFREQRSLMDLKTTKFLGPLAKGDSGYQQLFNIAPMGIMQTNYQGKVLFANPAVAHIFGFLSAKEFKDVVNAREGGVQESYVDENQRKEILNKLYRERQSWIETYAKFFREDKSVFDATIYLSLRYDEEREEDVIIGFLEDATERLNNERRLKASEERFRSLIEKANSIILKVDPEGRILYINEYAEKFFGFSSDEMINQNVVGTIIEDVPEMLEDVRNALKDICKNPNEFRPNESKNVCKDGREAWVKWSNKAIFDDEGKIHEILAIGTEVTQNKNLEYSLQNQVASERLLKEVSHRLAISQLVDAQGAVQQSLEQIKDFFEAKECYICIFDENGFVEHFYTSWLDECNSCKDFVGGFFLSNLSWWVEEFNLGEMVTFSDVNSIPKIITSSLEVCEKYGVKSIAAVPIFDGEKFIGFVGMNSDEQRSSWAVERMDILKICGEIFFSAIKKKTAQEDLLTAKERIDLAVRGGYLGMYDWHIQSGKVLYNDIWFRMLGYSPHEFPHTVDTWKELLHPEDKERVLKSMTKYLQGANPLYHEEFRLKTKDNGWKWIQSQGHVVERDGENNPVRMIGLHRDITELKLKAQELARQRDMFRLLIENMPLGIFVKDVQNEFRFVIWNRSMGEIFGIYRNDVLGKNVHDLFDKTFADMYLKDDMEVIRSREIKIIEREPIQTTTEEKWVRTIKVPILDENNKPLFLLGILEDLTKQQQMERQFRHTQKMQSIGQLAAGVAHEVKNPLAIIQLAAEGLLINKDLASDQKIFNKVNMIKRSALKADEVIKELLKFSRLSDEELGCVNLHEVIEDARLLSQNRDKEKDIVFSMKFYHEPLMCLGSEVLIEQVFVNLFNNSIDAIKQRGEIIVRTDLSRDQKWIIIEVKDTGQGIPDHVMEKIFDPFFTTKEIGLGTGLGLSTIFMIIEKYKGSVAVDSTLEEGTTFTIKLPYSQDLDQKFFDSVGEADKTEGN